MPVARSVTGAVVAVAVLAAAGACGEPAPSEPSGAGSPSVPATAPSSGPAAPAAIRVSATVTGGKVRTAHRRVKVPRGAAVEITVTSDTADEFHLHGYDRELDLPAGRPATLRLTADTPGVFEAELHHSGVRVFELQVG
jgi:hypothetical protein